MKYDYWIIKGTPISIIITALLIFFLGFAICYVIFSIVDISSYNDNYMRLKIKTRKLEKDLATAKEELESINKENDHLMKALVGTLYTKIKEQYEPDDLK